MQCLVTTETLAKFSDAWNAHDVDALMSFMADDCEFHTVAGPGLLGASMLGREAVRQAFAAAFVTWPDAQWADGVHAVMGDRGISETTFKATRNDGMRMEARMIDVFTFKGDKILIKNSFCKDRPMFKV